MNRRTFSRSMFAILPSSWALARASAGEPPSASSRSGSAPRPAPAAQVPSGTLEESIARGVAYLWKTQNADGSWGSPRWTGGVDQDPVPGAPHSFGVATTALCLEALLDAGDNPEVKAAAARAEAFQTANLPKLRRADLGNVPNVWGYTYGIQVLTKLALRAPAGSDRRKGFEAMIRDQVKGLEHFETVHGGWFYYASGFQRPLAPSASFVNAAVLVALARARALGIAMSRRVLDRAIRATADQRKPDSSYLYSMSTPLDK